METVKTSEATRRVPNGATVFCCASYESRSVSFPASLQSRNDINFVLFSNEESQKDSAENRAKLTRLFNKRLRPVRLRKRAPLFTADVLAREFEGVPNDTEICIDVSTFTREAIFLMIRIIDELGIFHRVHFFYARASAYSLGSKPGEEWLSRGVSGVRSVLGYPGNLTPGRPLHLIILLGIEFDRAMRLCEDFEPNYVSIGIGAGDRAFDREVTRRVESVGEKMKQYNASCSTFNFSTVDAIQSAQDIGEVAKKTPGFNGIIAAMSNKISTVGVALAGIINKELQLAYAEPIEYNIDNYSAPGDDVIHFRLNKSADGSFGYVE